jgi:hypothetical protein
MRGGYSTWNDNVGDDYDSWMQNVFKPLVRRKVAYIFGFNLDEAEEIVRHYDNKREATRKA